MRLDTTQHEEKNGHNLAIVQVEGGDSQCDIKPKISSTNLFF